MIFFSISYLCTICFVPLDERPLGSSGLQTGCVDSPSFLNLTHGFSVVRLPDSLL